MNNPIYRYHIDSSHTARVYAVYQTACKLDLVATEEFADRKEAVEWAFRIIAIHEGLVRA